MIENDFGLLIGKSGKRFPCKYNKIDDTLPIDSSAVLFFSKISDGMDNHPNRNKILWHYSHILGQDFSNAINNAKEKGATHIFYYSTGGIIMNQEAIDDIDY